MLIKLLFVQFFMLMATGDPIEIWQNNRAVDQFNQKKLIEAHDQFAQLLSEKPFHPLFQFNLAASFLGVEEIEKAIKMYKEVLKLSPLPPELEFTANYNLGVLYGTKDLYDLDKALAYYQAALKIQPESKEVKTNIELLFKGQGEGGKGKKDQKDKSDQNKDQEPKEYKNSEQDPKPSPEMSKRDVKKILGEIKKQEQRIRAKHERKGKKREANREKSW